jgi:hypothetical protein
VCGNEYEECSLWMRRRVNWQPFAGLSVRRPQSSAKLHGVIRASVVTGRTDSPPHRPKAEMLYFSLKVRARRMFAHSE